jgi:hypothetical protein
VHQIASELGSSLKRTAVLKRIAVRSVRELMSNDGAPPEGPRSHPEQSVERERKHYAFPLRFSIAHRRQYPEKLVFVQPGYGGDHSLFK